MRPTYSLILVTALAMALGSNSAFAQNNNGDNGQQLSKDERRLASLRESMQVLDDAEWKALLPKITKVQVLSRQARDLHDMRRALEGARSFAYSADGQQAPYYLKDLADRARDVRMVWNDPNAHPNSIQRALTAFREARTKADKELSAELEKSQKELRDLVTARQELALIMAGLLD
jgi:hypothetical protein